MKIKNITLLLVTLIASACNSDTSNKPISSRNTAVSYNEAYQAPFFNSSGRKASVLSMMPTLEALYANHARIQQYPSHFFGVVLDGELIATGGKGMINLEEGFTVDANTKFHIASMTKSLTAMAIVKLRDEGRLSLEDAAVDYIPELKELEYLTRDASPITIFNLMTMSSGFPEDNPWADRRLEDSEEAFSDLMSSGLSFSNVPGYTYEYSNLGFAMLGRIITKVSGMSYQAYINREILEPLGMRDTYWEYEDVPREQLAVGYRWQGDRWEKEPMLHTGAFGAIGGLITSMNDFSKYVIYLMNAWPPRNEDESGPLKRSSLREMQTPFFARLSTEGIDQSGNTCATLTGYGYGLSVKTDCRGNTSVSHSGGLPGFGSQYTFFPDYGIGIISFANRTYAGTTRINQDAMEILMTEADLAPRQLPISGILHQRSNQVFRFLRTWDDQLGDLLFADNFYLDFPRQIRKIAFDELDLGEIQSMDSMVPLNHLRGTFKIRGTRGEAEVFFSLSPEEDPKVQALRFRKLR
ncbi:MAG: beta-lactamase family protein [Saprospiraceae bacterium]|nr:beta-lactamase family protein [Saprospiraceae bacterium]